MPFKVILSRNAERDMEEIDDYVTIHDSPEKAEHILEKIAEAFGNLSEFPNRGTYPKELSLLRTREIREVFFKPYRIIYRVAGKSVYVLLIADGRRDLRTTLLKRLLGMRH